MQCQSPANASIRNRRFVYMQTVLAKEGYFTLDAMRERNPRLYQECIGSDGQGSFPATMKLSERLMYNDRLLHQHQTDKSRCDMVDTTMDEDDGLNLLRQLMERAFLDGFDVNYVSYSSIDEDASLDMSVIRQQDEEDAFFAD
jgi:hypothetical protein